MSEAIIRVENLGKKYIIGHQQQEGYRTLRDVIVSQTKSLLKPLQNIKTNKHNSSEEFWSLKDVSFEIQQGDRVGIIGRNGAGKSTLLKILSRITEPTKGRIQIQGRVASLLEVGTGFHPELTGRENVYLNGAILGMSKVEIKRKFDEIVAFAEIEKFLDTPVKRYSSGMYVRLAFAVAAHLEPEILIVDEVLAVGDAQFQKKCLGKMESVSTKEGKTILFVSHNVRVFQQLCNNALFLEKGILKDASRDINSIARKYLLDNEDIQNSEWSNIKDEFQNSWFEPLRFLVVDKIGNKLEMPVRNDASIVVRIEGKVKLPVPDLTIGYAIYTDEEHLLYWSYQTDDKKGVPRELEKGFYIFSSEIPKRFLNEGIYKIELIASLHNKLWLLPPGQAPSIYLNIKGGLSDSIYWDVRRPGQIAPLMKWDISSSY